MFHQLLLTILVACPLAVATAAERDEGSFGQQARCAASPERGREAGFAARQFQNAEIPPRFHEALARLTRVAQLPKGVRVELVGVQSNRSASVLASGTIVLSSRLWRDDIGLDADEAAAVIAHELAHLELSHLTGRLCQGVASVVNDGQAVRMMRDNHLRELDADRRAAQLLARAGIASGAVGRMLLKLARNDGGGYSGSHPALETRLENLGLYLGP